MKITKATIKRINANRVTNPDFNGQLGVIEDILVGSAVICGDPGRYEANDGTDELVWPTIYSDGTREFVSGRVTGEYGRRIVAGLAQKYPSLISATLTSGMNGVSIYDVNALVRVVFKPTPPDDG